MAPHPPATLVVFDVDGTLIDSQDVLYRTHERAFGEHGLALPPREAVLALVGRSLPLMMESLAGPDAPLDSLVESYKRHFMAEVSRPDHVETLYPGAAAALARLSAVPGLRLAIATGKSRRGMARIVERLGWDSLFVAILTADDAPSKPHPGMVLQAMAQAGAAPRETIVVGDTTFDMEMARAAGARAIGVAWGYHPPEALLAAGAERVLAHFDELTP
jgi:phosphoglycolate phosphatase